MDQAAPEIRLIWEFESELSGDEGIAEARRLLDGLQIIRGVERVFQRSTSELEVVDALADRFADVWIKGDHDAVEAGRRLSRRLAARYDLLGGPYVGLRTSSSNCSRLDLQCPPANGCDIPDFSSCQRYLKDATAWGVDAFYSWDKAGGKGDAIQVVDVEEGWNLKHSSVPAALLLGSALPNSDHGTAVLGVLGAPHIGTGIQGIAENADFLIAPIGDRKQPDKTDGFEQMIVKSAEHCERGSVILVEVQGNRRIKLTSGEFGWSELLPVEALLGAREAIEAAISSFGQHVVAVAGNGGVGLDRYLPPEDDSGSIVVGAACPATTKRLKSSNHGKLVKVHAWGRQVVTAGGNTSGIYSNLASCPPNNSYTSAFNGTSSAAAIVAGVVACIGGVAKANGAASLDPVYMRDLLVRSSERASGDGIGVQPDLKKAIALLIQDEVICGARDR